MEIRLFTETSTAGQETYKATIEIHGGRPVLELAHRLIRDRYKERNPSRRLGFSFVIPIPNVDHRPLIECTTEIQTAQVGPGMWIEIVALRFPHVGGDKAAHFRAAIAGVGEYVASIEATWEPVYYWLAATFAPTVHEHKDLTGPLQVQAGKLEHRFNALEKGSKTTREVYMVSPGPCGPGPEPYIGDPLETTLQHIVKDHDGALAWLLQEVAMIKTAVEDLDARTTALERWANQGRIRRLVARFTAPIYPPAPVEPDPEEVPF